MDQRMALLNRRVDWWRRRLAPKLPDVDPHDLDLILSSILRQRLKIERSWIWRDVGGGAYAL